MLFGKKLLGDVSEAPLPADIDDDVLPACVKAERHSMGSKLEVEEVTPGLIAFSATLVCNFI